MGRTGRTLLLLGAIVLVAALGPAAAASAAEVLFQQPVGPSGGAVPSQEVVGGGGGSTYVADDFVVPKGTHWRPTALQVYGTAATQRGRTFRVRIWPDSGASFPADEDDIYEERVPVPGGPNYLIPLAGVPRLESGSYWIQARAITAGGEDSWNWLTGPNTPGTYPALFASDQLEPEGAEPGLAFQLLGTATQLITTYAEGYSTVSSEPAGISCTTICVSEFPRGTSLKLTSTPLTPSMEFKEWQWRGRYPEADPNPCVNENPCTFALNQDLTVMAKSVYLNKITVLRTKLDRRTGRGQLIVWLPGTGTVKMRSRGVQAYNSGPLPAGELRIPLIPQSQVAQRLHKNGSAAVSVALTFHPVRIVNGGSAGTVHQGITLVRKGAKRPARRIH